MKGNFKRNKFAKLEKPCSHVGLATLQCPISEEKKFITAIKGMPT